jgi:hypothetical protein
MDAKWREDIPLRAVEIGEDYDGCELILYPEAAGSGDEWEVWLGVCGIHDRYETLPDYMDYTIEKFQQQTP